MKKNLYRTLEGCNSEEEVKFAFLKYFNLKLDSRHNIDFYTPQILFEFKYNADLHNVNRRARAFAQALYYIRRLRYGDDARLPSRFIAVVDKHSAAVIPSDALSDYYLKSKRAPLYDWDLAPSTPCKKLTVDLSVEPSIIECRVYDFVSDSDEFVERLRDYLQSQLTLFELKKDINEDNFYAVFEYWNKLFGSAVENSHKPSEYFLTDIELGRTTPLDADNILFRLGDGTLSEKRLPLDAYKTFWAAYERVSNPRTMISIRQKMDRMTELELRRFTGEFFTPVEHARKALEYISRVVGERWWKSGRYRLWDMAAGTGNLEFALPSEALPYCYISTLLDDDAAYCRRLYPTATVFQYDYLNDDVNFLEHSQQLLELGIKRKMPQRLVDDLNDPTVKWIVFINPPYATASNFQNFDGKITKYGVSMTAIRRLMTDEGMGVVSRELSSQFFYRIHRELGARPTLLAVFSKIKYVNAPYDQTLRDSFFDYKFECGFMFESKHFHGTKGRFPIGFALWNFAEHIPLIEQTIELDVLNDRLEKIAVKKITSAPRGELINQWFEHPPSTKKFLPLSSALTVGRNHKMPCDRIAEGFIASLMSTSNDFMHQNYTALLSAPYVSAGAFSITPTNFEQCMVVHAVRRLPRATWLNDRDQFFRPSKTLPTEFINDCVVWSLFSASNNTAALANVEYEGVVYQIKNNLYPWTREEVSTWRCSMPEILYSMSTDEDRFAARWLKGRALSSEAAAVLEAAREIYRQFYARMSELDRTKYKIETWDAGWYQVRRSMDEADLLDARQFRAEFERLGEKLLPQIYELGFLRDEVSYFD